MFRGRRQKAQLAMTEVAPGPDDRWALPFPPKPVRPPLLHVVQSSVVPEIATPLDDSDLSLDLYQEVLGYDDEGSSDERLVTANVEAERATTEPRESDRQAETSSALRPGVVTEVRVLGPVEVVGWRNEPGRRVVAELCCYLALHDDQPVTAENLLAALWPDGREASAKSLRTYLSLLRRSLGADLFPEADKGAGYELSGAVSTDWRFFQILLDDAAAAERDDDPEMAALLLRRALGLVRGTPFAGVANGSFGWAWTELLVSHMERAVVSAALQLTRFAGGSGDLDMARWSIGQGLMAVPFDHELWACSLAVARREGSGPLVRAVRDCRAVLGDDAAVVIGTLEQP